MSPTPPFVRPESCKAIAKQTTNAAAMMLRRSKWCVFGPMRPHNSAARLRCEPDSAVSTDAAHAILQCPHKITHRNAIRRAGDDHRHYPSRRTRRNADSRRRSKGLALREPSALVTALSPLHCILGQQRQRRRPGDGPRQGGVPGDPSRQLVHGNVLVYAVRTLVDPGAVAYSRFAVPSRRS